MIQSGVKDIENAGGWAFGFILSMRRQNMQPFVDGKRPAKGSVLVPDPRKTLSPIFSQAEKHVSCNPSDEGLLAG